MSSGSRWRELGQDQWIEITKAMYSRFGEVQITDRAAALTYYAVLSLFPGLLVAVAILALVGEYPQPMSRSWTRFAKRHRGRRLTRSTAGCGTRCLIAGTPALCSASAW